MVRCVVSGCPNRVAAVNRGVLQRTPKRFFRFPKEPARVQDPGGGSEKTSATLRQRKQSNQSKKVTRHDVSLGLLTRRFLQLLLAASGGSLDLRQATTSLETHRQRVNDITNVPSGINLIQKESADRIKWTPDGGQRSPAGRLLEALLSIQNGFPSIQLGQTVIIIRAPDESQLEVPAPGEDSIQWHLKAEKGPIVVGTCEMGSGGAVTSDPAEKSSFFLTLEKSRIRTTPLCTESSGLQST